MFIIKHLKIIKLLSSSTNTFNLNLAIKEQFISGNTVTVMSPEGKPIQMNAMALQAAADQNAAGMLGRIHIENCMKYFMI